jgi:hypothetical protein
MHAYIRALVEVLPLAPDVFAPSCLFELAVLFNRGNDQALEGRSYLLLLALYYVVIKLVIMINGACIGLNVLIFSNYTHATSRCFVRHKLDNQSKAQHEVIVIHFSIVVTLGWFSSLRPVGQGNLYPSTSL